MDSYCVLRKRMGCTGNSGTEASAALLDAGRGGWYTHPQAGYCLAAVVAQLVEHELPKLGTLQMAHRSQLYPDGEGTKGRGLDSLVGSHRTDSLESLFASPGGCRHRGGRPCLWASDFSLYHPAPGKRKRFLHTQGWGTADSLSRWTVGESHFQAIATGSSRTRRHRTPCCHRAGLGEPFEA